MRYVYWLLVVSMVGVQPAVNPSTVLAGPTDDAAHIVKLANFHGGLAIHFSHGDEQLTAALHRADNCTVQRLERDPERVAKLRAALRKAGVYGPVSVVPWDGKRLPYVDNLVTLVVCEDPDLVSLREIERVLRPFGTALIQRDGHWTIARKPQMPGTDQWQQHYHNADNNAVAADRVVAPPRHLQWTSTPEWQRSHLAMPSINSMLSANGRLFTVEDQASAEHPVLPGEQALVARDAYNGVVLWRVPFTDWYPTYIRNKEMPVQIQRRAVAVGERVYCTPGYSAPITVFDAATGNVIKKFTATQRTMEFVYDQGVLFAITGDQDELAPALSDPKRSALNSSLFPLSAYGPVIRRTGQPRNRLVALDADTGRELWSLSQQDMHGYQGASLGVIDDCVVFATTDELVCLERATGKPRWRVPAPIVLQGPAGIAVALVLSPDAVYLGDSKQLRAFRLTDGKQLWTTPVTINHHKAPDVFLANGLVWAAAYDAATGRPAPALGLPRMGVNGFNPLTGKLVKKIDQTMTGPMGHDRCYRNRITERFYINSVTGGSDFLDLNDGRELPNPWIRSTCGIGPLPCNGLYYVGPPSCACCNSVMLNAMNAMAPEPALRRTNQPIPIRPDGRLEKGPAFGKVAAARAAASDWPTYRHDNARTGATSSPVSAQLDKLWETRLGAHVSAPVIAAGKVFAADVDGHSLCAMSATDGKILWRVYADARIDSPPTYYQGLVLFGSRDGTAYCVRARDGQLVWRFHPLEQRVICAYGQTESAWPICGSVLVRDGRVYFAAGRDSFVDDGIFLYALDARTGKLLHQGHVYGPFGKSGFPIDNRAVVQGMSIEGFINDIFVAGDNALYLRHQGFTKDLKPIALRDVKEPHLITSHGFLEAIPQHRSFWTIDTKLHYDIPTGRGGIHGDILVIDGDRFYEVRGYTPGRTAWFDPRTNGYTLYAGLYGAAAKAAMPRRDGKPARAKQAAAKARKTNKRRRQARTVASVAKSVKLWASSMPLTGKAMTLAGDTIFVAGTPVAFPKNDLAKAYEGRMGGVLWAASKTTGAKLASYKLDAPPVWDSLAAAGGQLYCVLADGRIVCWRER